MKATRNILLALFILSLSSCYKEIIVEPYSSNGVFNFKLTPEQEEEVYNARGISFLVENPIPSLYREGHRYPLDRFEIRGESTLKFRRKSYSINMDTSFFLHIDHENQDRDIEEYKLLSLVYDYTYIEGAIGYAMFRKLNMLPTHTEYIEVMINDHTQGVYLLFEDPVEYFLYQRDASFVLRRYYNHSLKSFHANEMRVAESDAYYISRFDSIYAYIQRYEGSQLYDSLWSKLDMKEYFTKMAVDMLVQNGDYTDEVFMYAKQSEGKEIFGVFPWDYDDLFQSVPHEIGRAWAVGTLFGTRTYGSMADIYADVGHKLIFSIEDDLDYTIARDDFLYQRYLEVLEEVLAILNDQTIISIVQDAKTQLQPFYDEDDIIAQSIYDVDETNQQLFDTNLEDKKQFLLDRRSWIMQELPNHKN